MFERLPQDRLSTLRCMDPASLASMSGLAVGQLDVATLLKAVIMVRRSTNACSAGASSLARLYRVRHRSTMLSEKFFPAAKPASIARRSMSRSSSASPWRLVPQRAAGRGRCHRQTLSIAGNSLHRLPRTHTTQCARRRRYADRHHRRIARRHRTDPRTLAEKLRKPCLVVDPTQRTSVRQTRAWACRPWVTCASTSCRAARKRTARDLPGDEIFCDACCAPTIEAARRPDPWPRWK